MFDQLLLSSIVVGERHRNDMGDLRSLARSIEEVGMLHPIVVTPDHRLIAGFRRLAACKSLGFDEVPVCIVHSLTTAASLLRAERDENTCRKDFLPTEAVSLGRELEALERPKAAERQGTRSDLTPSGKLPESPEVRDVVAPAVGMGARTYAKARTVVEAAEDATAPEPVRAAAREAKVEMDRTGKVDPAHRKVQQAKSPATGTPQPPVRGPAAGSTGGPLPGRPAATVAEVTP